jgi:hypothetical protein
VRLFSALLTVGLAALPAWCQLHVISGGPAGERGDNQPPAVFRVEADGSLGSVADPAFEDLPAAWIAVNNDLRRAVMVVRDRGVPRMALVVMDLDSAVVTKACAVPLRLGSVPRWLFNLPGRGVAYVEYAFSRADLRPGVLPMKLKGVLLEPSVPCDQSFIEPRPAELREVAASGAPGLADFRQNDGLGVSVEPGGGLVASEFGGAGIGIRVPAGMLADSGQERLGSSVVVNNSRVLALRLIARTGPGGAVTERVLACRKSDGTWQRVPQVSERTAWMRGFGSYLAIAEAQQKTDSLKVSTGSKVFSGRYAPIPLVFSGRLHLYDVQTEMTRTIETNDGDSEVLLVEDGVVYYRSSDRLFSVPITKTGFGEVRLLATANEIRDAHWAFIKH